MKQLTWMLFLTLISGLSFGQQESNQILTEIPDQSSDPIIHITDKLHNEMIDFAKKNGIDLSHKPKLGKVSADDIGDEKLFWVSNSVTGQFDQVNFRLMKKGTVAQIWFATGEINNGNLNAAVADTMFEYLENKTLSTSYDKNRGIVKLVQDIMGDTPNYDGDGLTDFLICDIKDGWAPGSTSGYVAGFFYSVDQFPASQWLGTQYKSNERDVLYIDSYPGINNGSTINPLRPLGTLSHEFQHLIHHKYNVGTSEFTFINEGQSNFASLLSGYVPHSSVSDYLNEPNVAIFKWNSGGNTLPDYGRAAAFTSYIWDRFGFHNSGLLTKESTSGVTGINNTLANLGSGWTFPDLLINWHTANYLGDTLINRSYGYKNNMIKSWRTVGSTLDNVNGSGSISVARGGVNIRKWKLVKNVTFTPTFASVNGRVRIIAKSTNGVQISDLTTTNSWTSDADVVYNEIAVLFMNVEPSSTGTGDFTTIGINYVISGESAFTISTFDYSGPAAYFSPLPSSNGLYDAFATIYESPKNGAIIQTISFTINGGAASVLGDPEIEIGLHQASGAVVGGQINAKNILANSLTKNYQVYSDIDMASEGWIVNQGQFAVQLRIKPKNSGDAVQLITDAGPANPSKTFRYNPTSGVYDVFGQNLKLKVVVGIPTSAGYESVELMPKEISLNQNYPNPFNPSTSIRLFIPENKTGETFSVNVYNLLGQLVKVLDSGIAIGGEKLLFWNGQNSAGQIMPSGLYFYELSVGSFKQTKQMILAK